MSSTRPVKPGGDEYDTLPPPVEEVSIEEQRLTKPAPVTPNKGSGESVAPSGDTGTSTIQTSNPDADVFIATGNRIVLNDEKAEYDWSKYPGGYEQFLRDLDAAKRQQAAGYPQQVYTWSPTNPKMTNPQDPTAYSTLTPQQQQKVEEWALQPEAQSSALAELERRGIVRSSQGTIRGPFDRSSVSSSAVTYTFTGDPATLTAEDRQLLYAAGFRPATNTPTVPPKVNPYTAKTPEAPPKPENLSDEGNLFADTRTPEQREADLLKGMEDAENAVEGLIQSVRERANVKLGEASAAKAKGDFAGTFLAYGGYTVGRFGAGVLEGATFFVRPRQILAVPETAAVLALDEAGRGEIFKQVAADPGGFILEGIGGAVGGYAVGKGFGKIVDAIEGPKGKVSRLVEVKVEQVPTETFIDEAGNVYATSNEVKTRLTPKVEESGVPRDAFSVLEKQGADIDTLVGYTKNKGYKTGYQLKVTPEEYNALLKGEVVEGSFIKGGSLALDEAEFPMVYATEKGQLVRGGGIQYFKEPAPMGPGVEGEVATIERGRFKLRVTGALEAEAPELETVAYVKPEGVEKTPFYPDKFPAKGETVNDLIKSSGAPSKLGDFTKPKPELDVFTKVKTVEAAKITPVASSFAAPSTPFAALSVISSKPSEALETQPTATLFAEQKTKNTIQGAKLDMGKVSTLESVKTPTLEKLSSIFASGEKELTYTQPVTLSRLFEEQKPAPATRIDEVEKAKTRTPPPVAPSPTSTRSRRRNPLWSVGGGGGRANLRVKGRLEYTPAASIEKIRRRLGL